MLTELEAQNFKSWESIPNMRLAPITGLFGSNSSGKTSILQLLLMLKQTVESSDRLQVLNFGDENSLTNLGSFREMIYQHDKSKKLHMSLSWDLSKPLKISDPEQSKKTLFEGHAIQFEATIKDSESGKLIVENVTYSFADKQFSLRAKNGSGQKYELITKDFKFVRTHGRVWDLPAPIKCYGFPDQVRLYHQNAGFLADLQLRFENLFTNIFYLGPLRDYPHRQYHWAGAEPADMGRKGEKAIDAILAAREKGPCISTGKGRGKGKKTLEEYVAIWLQRLGLIHSFSVKPIADGSNLYRVEVQKTSTSAPVMITDVGFGVSQILPVLVLCYYVPEGSTILLEQPEIHLHPSVQAGLADVFIDAVKWRNVQIIFESHSEHLLRRLQRRIAEGTFEQNNAALYFCEANENKSSLTSLPINLFGEIANWPKDFFGDEFGELAAMHQARIQQKRDMQE